MFLSKVACAHCVTVIGMDWDKYSFGWLNRKLFNWILNMKQSKFVLPWNVHIRGLLIRQLPSPFGYKARVYGFGKYSCIVHCHRPSVSISMLQLCSSEVFVLGIWSTGYFDVRGILDLFFVSLLATCDCNIDAYVFVSRLVGIVWLFSFSFGIIALGSCEMIQGLVAFSSCPGRGGNVGRFGS